MSVHLIHAGQPLDRPRTQLPERPGRPWENAPETCLRGVRAPAVYIDTPDGRYPACPFCGLDVGSQTG